MKRLKGLFKDSAPVDQPQGTYRHAENANINLDLGAISSEEGNVSISENLPNGYLPISYNAIFDNSIIIFSANLSGGSEIGKLEDDTYTTILNDSDLNFDTTSTIESEIRVNGRGDTIIYWVDGINPPRYLNISNVPSYDSIEELNMFTHISDVGDLGLNSVSQTGGALMSGSYVLAMRYLDEDGNPSNFFSFTKPISIIRDTFSNGFVEGTDEVPTGKSINLGITNIDTSYDAIQIAFIRYIDGGIADVGLLPQYQISSDTASYIFSGTQSFEPFSIEEITINYAFYTDAKSITQLDNVLYLGNVGKDTPIDYQKYANNIKTELVTKELGEDVGGAWAHGSEEYTYFDKSFRREEVYAFYISFILNNGNETEAFHIPGRAAEATEKSPITTHSDNATDIDPDALKFHFFANKGTNGMAYWENEQEVYPNDERFKVIDIDGNGDETEIDDLAGDPVRHHRFPHNTEEPIISAAVSGSSTNAPVTILGIKFKDIKLPSSIKDRVKGIKFYYAKKDYNNRLVVEQSLARGVELYSGDNVWGSPINNSDTSATALEMKPFSALTRRINLGNVDYLRKVAYPKLTQADVYGLTEVRYRAWMMTQTNIATGDSEFISKKGGISYLDGDPNPKTVGEDDIDLSSFGFRYPAIQNAFDHILIESASDDAGDAFSMSRSIIEEASEDDPFYAIYNLMSHKKELFNSFDQQELVYMGLVETDIDKFDPTHGSYTGISSNSFSGDTFINMYGYRNSFSELFFNVVESYDNIAYRQSGEDYGELNANNPDLSEEILRLEQNDDIEDFFYDNYFAYNESYSQQAVVKSAPPAQKNTNPHTNFSTRVLRSQDAGIEDVDNFRVFLENDYLDLSRNRGEITNLSTLNDILFVHTERALFRTRGREELITGDFRAFLGSGDIFSVQPAELINTSKGFAGLQDRKSAISTESGYFFVDTQARKVYRYGEGLDDISDKGMRKYFDENLKWYIDEAKDHNDISHVSMVCEYDSEYDRLLLTKVDYKPTTTLLTGIGDESIDFNTSTEKFRIVDGGTDIEYSDTDYFEDKSFTISYLPEINAWVSFHSYKPIFYCSNIRDVYSIKDGTFYKHNSRDFENTDYANFYGTQESFNIQVIDNREPSISKHLVNLEYILDTGTDWDKNFDQFRIKNDVQDSGLQNIVYFTQANGNARNVQGTWRINKFRDMIDPDTGELDQNLVWHKQKRFTGKYALIELYYNNPTNQKLSLVSLTANFKESIR